MPRTTDQRITRQPRHGSVPEYVPPSAVPLADDVRRARTAALFGSYEGVESGYEGLRRPGQANTDQHLPDKDKTMSSFTDDISIVDPTTIEQTGPQYPVAQWHNGEPKLAAAGGVQHTGGVILTVKNLPDDVAPPNGWVRTTITFSSGKSEIALAAQKPALAVIRTRFRWFVTFNGVTTYYPRKGYVADSGMRGHTQALCAVPGLDFPIVVTFKGTASKEFEKLLRDASQKIAEAAVRIKREARFPRFAFYLKLAPAPHTKAGQKGQESIVTPPVAALPDVLDAEYLNKIYVGRDRLADLQEIYRASFEWGTAWDRPGAEAARDVADELGGEVVERDPEPF